MESFVDVILPIPLEKQFTYCISKETAAILVPGMRVAVPFGKSKIFTGLVSKIHTNPPLAYEAKEIHQILDTQPTVTKVQLEHWKWMAAYYMCTLGEVFRSAVPSSFLLESETLILKNEDAQIEDVHLDDNEFLIQEALEHQPSLKINDVSGILDRKTVLPVLQKMLDKDLIKLKEEVHEQYKPKMVRYIGLSDEVASEEKLEELLKNLNRAPAQSRVILTLFQMQAGNKKPIKAADLQQESGASATIIKSLVDKEILKTYFIRTDRVVYDPEAERKPSKSLNDFQKNSLQSIKSSFENKKVSLLHGVTSSGK
ncbi:MAG: primosomal protein N', partial [Eudoraea sp.]|nr:primosomal protein N' [Eudoraea sp.]